MLNRYKHIRANMILNSNNDAVLKGEFFISSNSDWAYDLIAQNAEIKIVSQTTPVLFHKTPGMIMRWWEN